MCGMTFVDSTSKDLLRGATGKRAWVSGARRARLIQEFAVSGLCAVRFAKLAGVKPVTFYAWLHKQKAARTEVPGNEHQRPVPLTFDFVRPCLVLFWLTHSVFSLGRTRAIPATGRGLAHRRPYSRFRYAPSAAGAASRSVVQIFTYKSLHPLYFVKRHKLKQQSTSIAGNLSR
jgi:hypothetical protein